MSRQGQGGQKDWERRSGTLGGLPVSLSSLCHLETPRLHIPLPLSPWRRGPQGQVCQETVLSLVVFKHREVPFF